MKRLAAFGVIVLIVAGIASCTLNNSGGVVTTTSTSFLVAQLSPDAPALGVFINKSPFDTGLVFGNYAPYYTGNSGAYEFSVYASGNPKPTLDQTVTLDPNKNYSYLLVDSFSKLKAVLVNDVITIPASDSVYIRFLDFAVNTTQPLNLQDSLTRTNYAAGRTFNDQAFNPSYAVFTELPSGAHTFYLTTLADSILAKQTITLDGGAVYTLLAKGIYGGTNDTTKLSIGQLVNYHH